MSNSSQHVDPRFHDLWGISKGHEGYSPEPWHALDAQLKEATDERTRARILEHARILRRELILPKTFGALEGRSLAEFATKQCFYLQLSHSLMGFFPAIHTITRRTLIWADNTLTDALLDALETRTCDTSELYCLVHERDGYGFSLQSDRPRDTPRLEFLDRASFDRLTSLFDALFVWRPGLL